MWSKVGYIEKFKYYWVKANSSSRSSGEFGLYLSFCCEFIVRAALVHRNPALNANIDDASVMYASGLPSIGKEKTINFNVAIGRLKLLLPQVSEDHMKALILMSSFRNNELHTDKRGFLDDQLDAVWPNILAVFVEISEFILEDLDELIGKRDADQAKLILKNFNKKKVKRISDLISIEKERFFSLSSDEIDIIRNKNNINSDYFSVNKGQYFWASKCPACANIGLLYGHSIGHSEPFLEMEEIVQEIRVQPDGFECKCCGFKVKGLDEVLAAKFRHEYSHNDSLDPVEFHGIDPLDYVDVGQIIQDYGDEQNAYTLKELNL